MEEQSILVIYPYCINSLQVALLLLIVQRLDEEKVFDTTCTTDLVNNFDILLYDVFRKPLIFAVLGASVPVKLL